jgi:DNA-binding MarR family transcriptional regulator
VGRAGQRCPYEGKFIYVDRGGRAHFECWARHHFTIPIKEDRAFARASDPETSKEAAASLDGKVTDLEMIALRGLIQLGEATPREVIEYLDEDGQRMTPRFRPLERKGHIRATGEKKKNAATGRRAMVYRATKRGIIAAAKREGGQ